MLHAASAPQNRRTMLAPASASQGILLVVEDDESGRALSGQLGVEFEGALGICARPDRTAQEVEAQRPAVVVFALASIEAAELHALALQARGARPFLLVLCDASGARHAASLCQQGLVDDYLLHFPTPADPARLATSLRLAKRVVAAGSATPSSAGSPPGPKRPVVLVVEDDEVLHHLVAAMVDSDTIELVFESDGAAALDRVRAVAPDLVLMDVHLPDADGIDLTQRLKNTPELAAIPVVMFTGEARMETFMRSMEAGAADFLVKPFTREALVAKLSKYLPNPA